MSSKFGSPAVQVKPRTSQDRPALKTPSKPPETADARTATPARATAARSNGAGETLARETLARRKPGRPAGTLLSNGVTLDAGKRRHPDYVQITAYITRKTHHAARLALLEEEMCAPDAGLAGGSVGLAQKPQGPGRTRKRHELSELIEELLAGWLAKQGRT